ncbi:MAG: ABC-2 transporter permease [Oscillospiraceae bacterium]|nr:ABC-2 transporter permease [Oscillospiraceae bacterium]
MKGLIIKDFYSLVKQLRMYILFIAVMTFIPGFSMITFAVVYTTMLPMTSIAYDERSKWDKLAAMMPYSATDIVLSKYILGALLVLGTAVFACFAQAIVGIFTNTALTGLFFIKLAFVVCFAFVMESIELPVLIRFGVEKGRLLIILFMVLVGVGGATLIDNVTDFISKDFKLAVFLPFAALAAVAVTALSAFISAKLYEGNKE